MVSRRGLDGLVEDFDKALSLVNEAAHVLEDASVFVSAAGALFARQSAGVIGQLNEVYGEIQRIKHELSEVSADD